MNSKTKRLILGGVILVVFLIYYLIPYRILNRMENRNKSEVAKLQSDINILQQDVINKQKYLDEIELFKEQIDLSNSRFPTVNSQERILYTLNDIENNVDVYFDGIVFAADEVVKTSNDIAYEQEKKYLDKLLKAKKSNLNETIDPPDLPIYDKFIKTSIATQTYVNYQGLKDLLTYMYPEVDEGGQIVKPNDDKNLNKRVVLENMSIVKTNVESDKDFEVSFIMSFYALYNEEREINDIFLGEYPQGKPNGIFQIYDALLDNDAFDSEANVVAGQRLGKRIEESGDFLMLLNPTSADDTSVVVGALDGNGAKSYVYDDVNSVSNVTMEFYMYNNDYYYRYKAGGDTYPNNYNSGIKFIPGEYIEIGVYSAERNGIDDKSGANVSILNKTDIDVNVYFDKEDPLRPRFKLGKTSGTVIVP